MELMSKVKEALSMAGVTAPLHEFSLAETGGRVSTEPAPQKPRPSVYTEIHMRMLGIDLPTGTVYVEFHAEDSAETIATMINLALSNQGA